MMPHQDLDPDARIRVQFLEMLVALGLFAAIAFIVVALPPASWWH